MIKRSHCFFIAIAVFAMGIELAVTSASWGQAAPRRESSQGNQLVTIGRLIRSGQSRNGTPRFALLGDDGSITAYVVPSANVDLGSYVNQGVAVTARRVSRGSDNIAYLLASRVSPMATGSDATSSVPPRPTPSAEPLDQEESLEMPRLLDQVAARPLRTNNALEAAGLADMLDEDEPMDLEAAFWDDADAGQGSAVQQAAHEVIDESSKVPVEQLPPIPSEGLVDDGYAEYHLGGSSCGRPDCVSCGYAPHRPLGTFWLRGEYLFWTTKGMDVPALVTTSTGNPAPENAGVLGQAGTQILYGSDELLDDERDGFRVRFGRWFNPYHTRGFEIDYFHLDDTSEEFTASSDGNPILARPFYNVQLNQQDAELVAYPDIVSGTVSVNSSSEFYSVAPRFIFNLACRTFCHPMLPCGGCNACGGGMCPPLGGSRFDFSVGYRYMDLQESLVISEQLVSVAGGTTATFDLLDAFETENEFNGVELGFSWDHYRGPWSLELTSRFSLGNNRRSVAVNGRTISSIQGTTFNDAGGLLALPTNIGTYEDDQFVCIPELGINLGYQIAPSLRFLVGYTFVYWNSVVRPGEQVDLRVNTDYLPPAIATTGEAAPMFGFYETSYWAQGLNLGLDWRW